MKFYISLRGGLMIGRIIFGRGAHYADFTVLYIRPRLCTLGFSTKLLKTVLGSSNICRTYKKYVRGQNNATSIVNIWIMFLTLRTTLLIVYLILAKTALCLLFFHSS